MNPPPLPAVLGKIKIPQFFSPTRLGATKQCKLPLVAEVRDMLPSGPQASLGELYHTVVARWLTGTGAESPIALFDSVLAEIDAKLIEDPMRRNQAPLRLTRTIQEWMGFRRRVLGMCERLPRGYRWKPKDQQERNREATYRSKQIETTYSSESLRLRGRPDSIRWCERNKIEVRDFKSGSILNEDGQLKEEIVFQLHAYGLLLKEEFPDAKIELIVDDGSEHRLPFGTLEQREAVENIATCVEGLSAGAELEALELAQPGQQCAWCAIRHRCPAYREQAPAWWRAYPREIARLPNDTWGRVESIEQRADCIRVRLIDPAGRAVVIDNISPRHGIAAADQGRMFWFFGFSQRGRSRSPDGVAFHPHNFFEMPRDSYEGRAWTAQIFA